MHKDGANKYQVDKQLSADRLKELVKASGLTRGQIELRTGISKSNQRLIESGKSNITEETRYAYLEAIKKTLFYFYNDERFDYLIVSNKNDLKVKPSDGGKEK